MNTSDELRGPMTETEIRECFGNLNVWRSGDQRAPHKPLLLLLVLGRIARGEPRLVEFYRIEDELRSLLVEFGPPRRAHHPNFPFWHLQSDGIWEIIGLPIVEGRRLGESASLSELRREGVAGGLRQEVYRAIRDDPDLLRELARQLLDDSFPESLTEEIAAAVGLELTGRTGRPRDPGFRDRVLIAYGYACAVCGYDLRLQHAPIALEAAHIKWHQAGGPSSEQNGLALCTMHHKLFDRGAMTLDEDRRVVVSGLVNGSTGLEEWLLRHDRQPLREPRTPDQVPLEEFVRWHVLEVFKGGSNATGGIP